MYTQTHKEQATACWDLFESQGIDRARPALAGEKSCSGELL